jgi:general secretion pathway protein F/type IV pilus assembly protein PilC
MVYVVPKIRVFLERVEKPLVTQALFGFSDLLVYRWPFVLAGVFGVAMAASSILKSERGREAWDRFKYKVPVLGKTMQMVAICRFCRILGTLLRNGVPMLQSLKIAKDSAGDRILAEEIDKASDNVSQGETLARPLGDSGLFPPDIIDMIAVAEESNNLDNVLVQIADSNEARTSRQIDLGVRLLEPLMLVVMAAFVAMIAVALLVPILKMSTAMGG